VIVYIRSLNRLTFNGDYELRVQLWDHDGVYGEVNYAKFKVLSENDNYKLILGNMKKNLDEDDFVIKMAHDSFSSHSGAKFSTKDNDNDFAETNHLSRKYKTAGWLKRPRHLQANLFGTDLNTVKTKESLIGVTWNSFRGSRYSLKQAIMAVRPTQHSLRGSTIISNI